MTTETIHTWCSYECPQGMTLRDYFAAKAMQGLLANPGGAIQQNGMSGWGWCNCTVDDVAEFAWHIADAMLKAREAIDD